MERRESGMEAVIRLMFRLLPVQILLAAVGSVNGFVSSFFASNFVGTSAMGAVGLFSPIISLFSALSTLLAGGSAILCGKYMGRNDQEKVRNVFSLNLMLSVIISIVFTVLFLVAGTLNLTSFFYPGRDGTSAVQYLPDRTGHRHPASDCRKPAAGLSFS